MQSSVFRIKAATALRSITNASPSEQDRPHLKTKAKQRQRKKKKKLPNTHPQPLPSITFFFRGPPKAKWIPRASHSSQSDSIQSAGMGGPPSGLCGFRGSRYSLSEGFFPFCLRLCPNRMGGSTDRSRGSALVG